jgi:hypothetical protein
MLGIPVAVMQCFKPRTTKNHAYKSQKEGMIKNGFTQPYLSK